MMGKALKTQTAFRLATVTQTEAQAAKKAVVWQRKHDSQFIPRKQDFGKIQTAKWITWLCSLKGRLDLLVFSL